MSDDTSGGIGRESLNLPNLITSVRLVLAFILFALISANGYWLTSAFLFVFAASTDALDGYLARRFQQVTVLGRILDPFVDKVIVCGSFIFLLEKQSEPHSGVTAWMVIAIIGREMLVSSLRGILEQQGKDFSASVSGKIKMALQCVAVTASLVSLSPDVTWDWLPQLRDLLLWSAVAVTIYSGLIYVIRAAQLLKQD
jgi:CDP-diacylglycerol--glycerol-3-phosphate 3-phosphatidyltransferase